MLMLMLPPSRVVPPLYTSFRVRSRVPLVCAAARGGSEAGNRHRRA
jgi:hypothetical protein